MMINRREFFGITAGAGATLALVPELLRALQSSRGTLIHRAIPSTGEMLPVIGVGSRPIDSAALKAVIRTLVDRGGRVVDTLHGGPAGEQITGASVNELGMRERIFLSTPLAVTIPTLPGYAGATPKVAPDTVRAQMEAKLATFKGERIDLLQLIAGSDIPTHLAVANEMKRAGRVRYIGVTDLAPPPQFRNAPFYVQLEAIMRNEPIDFIGVDYSVGDRRVEERILPLAQERKIGVIAYFPFDRSRIFQRASSTPLPEWAAEFDATTWAQFFLKYVVGHPAVTVVRTGTSSAAHMLDNIGGGIGRLPNDATRRRMAELVDAFPPTPIAAPPRPAPQPPPVALPSAILDRYVGEYLYVAAATTLTFRRDGERLLLKVSGNMPEGAVVARSETRFSTSWGATIEFALDRQGAITGAHIEQGPYRIPLERK